MLTESVVSEIVNPTSSATSETGVDSGALSPPQEAKAPNVIHAIAAIAKSFNDLCFIS